MTLAYQKVVCSLECSTGNLPARRMQWTSQVNLSSAVDRVNVPYTVGELDILCGGMNLLLCIVSLQLYFKDLAHY